MKVCFDSGGGLPPSCTDKPTDLGGDRNYKAAFVVLAVDLAAARLGLPLQTILLATKVDRALSLALKGKYNYAIELIDGLRLKDCFAMIDDSKA